MLIRRLRFKNLNSLVGEWELDFTNPAVASEGIIAITGPTGAGKSTILDAISLALYGRTPRLSSINANSNEIMSRHTGECFAEVTFETHARVYRSHWSQRRAQRKADGKLQDQKREIADALSGEILASKIQDAADLAVKLTGMDFGRFTRTMFLAQGQFAAFLLARPDERAPILEQITGTGVYAAISQRVHERYVEERKKQEEASAVIQAIETLSPEEEERLSHELQQLREESQKSVTQIAKYGEEIAWLKKIASLEQELQQVEIDRQNWKQKQQAFAPKRARLERAERAFALSGAYAELCSLRRERDMELQSLGQCDSALLAARDEAAKAETAARLAQEALHDESERLKGLTLLCRKVKDLDLQFAEKGVPLKASEEDLANVKARLQNLEDRSSKAKEELRQYTEEQNALQVSLQASQADEGLVEQLEALRTRFDFIRESAESVRTKAGELSASEEKRQQSLAAASERADALAKAVKNAEALGQELESVKNELTTILGSASYGRLRDRQDLLTARIAGLEQIVVEKRSFDDACRLREEARSQKVQRAKELESVNTLLPERERLFVEMESKRDLLEQRALLLQKIGAYEEERAGLSEGSPCPLCGALNHPYAREGAPDDKNTVDALSQYRKELKSVQESISSLKLGQLALRKDIERHEKEISAAEAAEARSRQLLLALAEKTGLKAELPAMDLRVKEELGQARDELEETRQKLAKATALIARQEALAKELQHSGEASQKAALALAEAEHAHKRFADAASLLQLEHRERAERLESLFAELQDRLRPYGLHNIQLSALDAAADELTKRHALRLSLKSKQAKVEQVIASLKSEIATLTALRHKEAASFAELQNKHELLAAESQRISQERKALFGEKDPVNEELFATQKVEETRAALDLAKSRLELVLREVAALDARSLALKASAQKRGASIQDLELAFGLQLSANAFTDEADFCSAILTEEERQSLAGEARSLAEGESDTASRQKQKMRELETERNKKLTGEVLFEIQEALQTLQARNEQMQREIGVILRRQQEDQEKQRQRRNQLYSLEQQRIECAHWERLHELIGSADGKKFRNFAQGLTFEVLIAYANKQLTSMSDRYILLPSSDSPLEFCVVDNYQAGEIRTTKNLSGGESFIVSLSLALGLSQMASSNVQAGALFLDEGFGSLDEESLDIALETLGGLRQDGRLIVLISHVQALKERIGARIKVSPITGGRSRISGPGCRAIERGQ